MKQIAILGPGTVGGGVAEILMKNADTVAASAGEEIGLKYAVARREMPDCPCADKDRARTLTWSSVTRRSGWS